MRIQIVPVAGVVLMWADVMLSLLMMAIVMVTVMMMMMAAVVTKRTLFMVERQFHRRSRPPD